MTRKTKTEVDWSLTTWKGSRLQQHREFQALPFARKLELMDDLQETMVALRPPVPAKVSQHPAKS